MPSDQSYITKLEVENDYLRRREADRKNADLQPQQPDYPTDQCNMNIGGSPIRPQTQEEVIDFLFTFHDNPSKTSHYIEIREAAKAFAKVIVRHTPGGQDRLTAINKLREVVMFANASIALDGRGL